MDRCGDFWDMLQNASNVNMRAVLASSYEPEDLEPAFVRNGFADPNNTTIPTLSNDIVEGSEHLCAISVLYSVNEMYLILGKDFDNMIENFFYETREYFHQKIPTMRHSELTLNREELIPGAVVCVRDRENEEFQRAKIIEKAPGFETYKIIMIDLGEYHNFENQCIFYLPKHLVNIPEFAIKARLELDTYYNERRNDKDWDKKVSDKILSIVYNRRVRVKFVKKVQVEKQVIWEVSLLGFGENVADLRRPIEQQVIAKHDGKYVKSQELDSIVKSKSKFL